MMQSRMKEAIILRIRDYGCAHMIFVSHADGKIAEGEYVVAGIGRGIEYETVGPSEGLFVSLHNM